MPFRSDETSGAAATTDNCAADRDVRPPLTAVIGESWALLVSILFLMIGAGLISSLVGIRAEQDGFDLSVTGVMVGAYYLGYVVGARLVGRGIREVGHVRVFAGLASIAATTAVFHGLIINPPLWIALRLVAGVCLAGLFIVAESWLNGVAHPETRGQLLGLYMVAVTGGLAAGQLLLRTAEVSELTLFAVASTIISLSVVPITLIPQHAPVVTAPARYSIRQLQQDAPLALVGSAAAGVGSAAALGFGAVFATRAGFDVGEAGAFVAAVLLGATLGQPPIGRLSDRIDRRWMIVAVSILVAVASVGGYLVTDQGSLAPLLACAMAVGAGVFPMYSLSLAHLADFIDADEMIGAGSLLILVNGMAAAAGPIAVATVVRATDPRGFFVFLGTVFAVVAIYAAWRITRRPAAASDDTAHYAPLPPSATPEVMELEAPVLDA